MRKMYSILFHVRVYGDTCICQASINRRNAFQEGFSVQWVQRDVDEYSRLSTNNINEVRSIVEAISNVPY